MKGGGVQQRGIGFWIVEGPGCMLPLYLLYAQAIPAFDYELGVAMGTQEPASQITELGTAMWWGFAFGDLLTYIPLLALGLVGFWLKKTWGTVALAAALGVSLYWPIVSLAIVAAASDAEGWSLPNEGEYWVILPTIATWSAFGLWHLAFSRK